MFYAMDLHWDFVSPNIPHLLQTPNISTPEPFCEQYVYM